MISLNATFFVRTAVLPLLVGAVLLTSCTINPLSPVQRGDLDNEVYSNPYWGFRFRVPIAWTAIDRPDVNDFCMAIIGQPKFSYPLFTCSRSSAKSSNVLMFFVQKNTSAENCLSYILTSTHPAIGVTLHALTINRQTFHHVQFIQKRGKKPYYLDLFAMDSQGDAVAILISREQIPGQEPMTSDPAELVERYFERTQTKE